MRLMKNSEFDKGITELNWKNGAATRMSDARAG